MIHNKNARKGFTLIEILVVIAIIAILASVVLIGLGPAQQAGRDSKRISDLRQIQNALEIYHLHCGVYPGGVAAPSECALSGGYNGGAISTLTTVLNPAGITQAMPDDPLNANHYQYTPALQAGTGYTLSAKLEDKNNNVLQGQQASQNGVTCDATSQNYCVSL